MSDGDMAAMRWAEGVFSWQRQVWKMETRRGVVCG